MIKQYALSQIAAALLVGHYGESTYGPEQAMRDAMALWTLAGEHASSLESGEPIVPTREMAVAP